jgi:hypothetical protein
MTQLLQFTNYKFAGNSISISHHYSYFRFHRNSLFQQIIKTVCQAKKHTKSRKEYLSSSA